MTITLTVRGIAITAIIVFILVTQIFACTRDDYGPFLSDRDIAIFFATIADIIFVLIIGGIFIW